MKQIIRRGNFIIDTFRQHSMCHDRVVDSAADRCLPRWTRCLQFRRSLHEKGDDPLEPSRPTSLANIIVLCVYRFCRGAFVQRKGVLYVVTETETLPRSDDVTAIYTPQVQGWGMPAQPDWLLPPERPDSAGMEHNLVISFITMVNSNNWFSHLSLW